MRVTVIFNLWRHEIYY